MFLPETWFKPCFCSFLLNACGLRSFPFLRHRRLSLLGQPGRCQRTTSLWSGMFSFFRRAIFEFAEPAFLKFVPILRFGQNCPLVICLNLTRQTGLYQSLSSLSPSHEDFHFRSLLTKNPKFRCLGSFQHQLEVIRLHSHSWRMSSQTRFLVFLFQI